jgi:hypothetical protein
VERALSLRESEGDHVPTVGNLGPVGSLGKDANRTPDNSAYLWEEVQGGQEGQVGQERSCIHGYRDGVGCYLCDPRHPYLLKHGGVA